MKTFHNKLRFRIVAYFCVFGAGLVAIYGLLVFGLLNHVEDSLFNTRLQTEVEDFISRYRQDRNAAPPWSHYISGYVGTENMPEWVRAMVRGLDDGFYETSGIDGLRGPEAYHVGVRQLPGENRKLYLLFDVGDLQVAEERPVTLVLILLAGFGVVATVGVIISLLSANRVFTPLRKLAETVQRSGPENLPTEFSGQFAEDEIGFLARTLENLMKRINAFVARERQFTRDASHELRTPLTVIQGAVELLQQSVAPGEKNVRGPVDRIARAAREMAVTIETFLWLAREEEANESTQPCALRPLVEKIVGGLQPLLTNKMVEIKIIADEDPIVAGPEAALRIAIANLIRNAALYTMRGEVRVTLRRDHIEVADSGPGIAAVSLNSLTRPHVRGKDSQGFGLGLSIVSRLCSRFGWQIKIESEEGQGTTVRLDFPPA
ncbi:MAG: HAMP domain-containing sensor histidine kinase [Desulfobacterales bacterium]